MRDLWLVITNEWMKLIHRKRLLVTLIIGAILLLFITLLSSSDRYDVEADLQDRIASQEQKIKDLEAELRDAQKQKTAPTPKIEHPSRSMEPDMFSPRDPERIKNELLYSERYIEELRAELKVLQTFPPEDWRKIVETEIATWKKRLQSPEVKQDFKKKEGIEATIKALEYRLAHNVPPNPLYKYEKSAYQYFLSISFEISTIFLPILIVILIADIVSKETTTGTIKLLLVRPISRTKILLGKWLTSLTATILVVIIFYIALLFICIGIYGVDGFNEPAFVLENKWEEISDNIDYEKKLNSVPLTEYGTVKVLPIWHVVIYTILFSTYAMLTVATIAFLCSTLFHSSMVSTGIAFSIIILGAILPLPYIVDPADLIWLFSLHLNPIIYGIHSNIISTVPQSLLVLTIWTVLSLLIAIFRFQRKDVLNA